MKDALTKVKSAIAPKDIASHLSHYLVKDEMIYASDNRMIAAAPFPLKGTFMVPGGDFEAVVDRFGELTSIEVNETTVVFKDGKLKATLKTLPMDTVSYIDNKGKKQKPPKGFLQALALVRPFISDNAVHFWALAICLDKEAMYATNNVVVAMAECKGLNGVGQLLPCWAIDYLLMRDEALEHISWEPTSITFYWSDKSWMRALLIDGKFPEQAAKLIDKLPRPSFHLTKEWKAAYTIVSEMTDALIEMHAERLVGVTPHGEVEFNIETPAPEEGVSKWHKKFLDPVVAIATRWSPETWPKPSPFLGEGIRGLIVGRN